jgi:hypothetical protein
MVINVRVESKAIQADNGSRRNTAAHQRRIECQRARLQFNIGSAEVQNQYNEGWDAPEDAEQADGPPRRTIGLLSAARTVHRSLSARRRRRGLSTITGGLALPQANRVDSSMPTHASSRAKTVPYLERIRVR